MLLKKGAVLEQYRIRIEDDPVESGGAAQIWRVYHMDWDICLSMKFPREEILADNSKREDFIRECKLWADLGLHPNIAPCYYVRDIDGVPAVFSEWSDMGSLADMISSDKLYEGSIREAQQRIMEIAIQVLQGLEYAHSQGVIHKDIKPGNILINSDDEVKLTDFGTAGAVIPWYTEEYVSPEQKNGGELTAVTDLYSWAVTVLEMFNGVCDWDDGSQIWKYLKETVDDLLIPMPDDVVNVLKGCLVPDPGERFSSVSMLCLLMISIYNAEFPESRYAGQITKKKLADTAGALNNKALSFMDLGEPLEAVNCWREALKIDYLHPESLYNYGIHRWQHGALSDVQLIQSFYPGGAECRKYTEKIEQVTRCKYIRSFEGFDPAVTEVDPENDIQGFSNNVDEISFSGDGSKLLALNDTDGKFIIWETATGKKLAEYPADRRCDIPDENWFRTDVRFDEENELVLEECGFWSVKLRKCGNDQLIKTFGDYEVMPPFSFSPDGKFFAANSGENVIGLWSVPEVRKLKPVLSRVIPIKEMAEYDSRAEKLWQKAEEAFENKNYRPAIHFSKLIEDIPGQGTSERLVKFKRDIFYACPHCARYDPRVLTAKCCEDIETYDVSFSPRGKYMIIQNGPYSTELWDCKENKYIKSIHPPCCRLTEEFDLTVCSMEFDGDEKFIRFYTEDFNSINAAQEEVFYSIEKGEFAELEKGGRELKWFNRQRCYSKIYNNICKYNNKHYAMSADGALMAEWEWKGSLMVMQLDYRIEYEHENNGNDRCHKFLRGEIVLNDETQRESKDLGWLRENNKFLLEIMNTRVYNYLYRLCTSKWAQVENPAIKFQQDSAAAGKFVNAHEGEYPMPKHTDPDVQKLIEADDEAYNRMLSEVKRQREFWHGADQCDIITLIIRTLELDHTPLPSDGGDTMDIPEFPHISPKEIRRQKGLPALADRVRNMRTRLLESVVGQDHAIHAFTEGIFNAEVLADSDKDRKRPTAVFTFAGPPGVGKTFLAEQAAELLGLPCRRFDMTEYASRQNEEGLIGIDYFYTHSSPGKLTTFVKENPKCVLIFDEIEKAHINTVHLFYQILDAGMLTDKYIDSRRIAAANGSLRDADKKMEERYKTEDPHVSFKDTIIIFTTNAGRSIYENDKASGGASVSRGSLINALSTEKNPVTGEAFFPTALVSRIAAGYPLMFNELGVHDLVEIIDRQYRRCGRMICDQYGISLKADDRVILSLLYNGGGKSDARFLGAQTELFFKNEIFKLLSVSSEPFENADTIEFTADLKNAPESVARLFSDGDKPEILLYTNRLLGKRCAKALTGCIVHTAQTAENALEIVMEKDIDFAVIDISHGSSSGGKTVTASMAASVWREGKKLFGELTEKFPDIPIYILEVSGREMDDELTAGFLRAGARGKLCEPGEDTSDFRNEICEISRRIFMENAARSIAAEHKYLYFETAPEFSENKVTVKLRNFSLKRSADADDLNDLLSETERPKERFDNVIGAKAAKKELSFFVDMLKDQKKYYAMGYRLPKGVLLHGKPGTGKTMLAKALAGEADIAFISTAASKFVNKYAGSGPAAVRELFKKARRYAPSIIFIDEVDTIAKQRTGSEYSRAEEDTLNALLAEMDGFAVDPKRPVFVLAATNYEVEKGRGIGILDEAFMRRFDRKILIELPDTEEREQYINLMLSKISGHTVPEKTVKSVAARSVGMSLAILSNVIETAKRMAFDGGVAPDSEILTEAFEVTRFGERKQWDEGAALRTARHEAGHTIISMLSGNIPAYVTIEARGNFGGYMEHGEEERNRNTMSKRDIINLIRTCLGGRSAEIVYYGETEGLDTGAGNDLEQATNYALNMVTRYGMDEKSGLAFIERSTALAYPEIMERVNEILYEEMENAVRLIGENKEKMDALVEELLRKNRLTGEEIGRLIGHIQ